MIETGRVLSDFGFDFRCCHHLAPSPWWTHLLTPGPASTRLAPSTFPDAGADLGCDKVGPHSRRRWFWAKVGPSARRSGRETPCGLQSSWPIFPGQFGPGGMGTRSRLAVDGRCGGWFFGGLCIAALRKRVFIAAVVTPPPAQGRFYDQLLILLATYRCRAGVRYPWTPARPSNRKLKLPSLSGC